MLYKIYKAMIDTTQLKNINIRDVYQALGFELRSSNGNGRCFNQTAHPNGDRNPSLGFDPRTNRFKCFSCGVSGDTIELVQQVQGVSFKEAVDWLADHFKAPVRQLNTKPNKVYINRPKNPARRPLAYELEPIRNQNGIYKLPKHINVYKALLSYTDEPNKELLDWWHGRGLGDDLLKQVQWRSITKETWQRLAKDFTSEQLLEAGLLTERPNGLTPLFSQHTVIVPFYDGDQLIYIRARSLDLNIKAKYLAPKGSSPPIYNYQALLNYDDKRPLYITESETDALALSELGETALALVGGQKHPDSLVVRELVHLVTECLRPDLPIHIATDRDDTGEVFFNSVAKSLYLAGVPSNKIVQYQCEHPEHKDISDCLKEQRSKKL